MSNREPLLNPVPIKSLRPTQITVGYREVAEKRREWRDRAKKHKGQKAAQYLGGHMIPVVRGPGETSFVIDHHHLCRALMEEGVADILVNVVLDLSALKMGEFWTFMDNRALCHPYDAEGQRVGFKAIPMKIGELKDDPYRSLAGELRRAGGYAKDVTPFSEFIWADFLRRRVRRKLVDEDFGSALTKALKLAKSPEAGHLPGWCGPSSAD